MGMKNGFLEELFRFGGAVDVTVGDSATATPISDDDTAAKLIVLKGTLTAARTAQLGHRERGADWVLVNATTGGYAVSVQGPTGAVVSVPNGAAVYGLWDGSKMVSAVALVGAGVITDANVAVGAAIDGLKINPNFGSQTIATLGLLLLSGATSGLVMQATSGAGSSKSTSYKFAGETSTTDATPTIVKSVTLEANAIAHIEAVVVGIKSDGSAHYCSKVLAGIRWDGAGAGSYVGANSLSDTRSNGTVTGILPEVITNGASTFAVRITGRAAETWRWGARIELHYRTTTA